MLNLNKILSSLLMSLIIGNTTAIANNSVMYITNIISKCKFMVTMQLNTMNMPFYKFFLLKNNNKIKSANVLYGIINNDEVNTNLIVCSSIKNAADYIKNRKLTSEKYIERVKSKKDKQQPVIVAIDAGHGGQDPGATSTKGLKEKNVTIAIARKLKAILDIDPMFKPVLTRDGDYFISVSCRSDVARKKSANVLVSIHADAAIKNSRASGASIWVLSNLRANNEMANWLEHKEKKEKLLGGAGYLLSNTHSDPYLSKTVLDLQFSYSQRVGYDIAVKILNKLKNICKLHKIRPEHASLGVLRSPDIPSILVETGFISNTIEEKLLSNSTYQNKIAKALYLGLRSYFIENPLQNNIIMKKYINNKQLKEVIKKDKNNKKLMNDKNKCNIYIVKQGDTLTSIANSLGSSVKLICSINKLNNDLILVGQRLLIPSNKLAIISTYRSIKANKVIIRHKILRGDTLTALANRYKVAVRAIKKANNIKSSNILLGHMLIIPQ